MQIDEMIKHVDDHEIEEMVYRQCDRLVHEYRCFFKWIVDHLIIDSKKIDYVHEVLTEERLWSLHGIITGVLAFSKMKMGDDMSLYCADCRQTFYDRKGLDRHVRQEHREIYSCRWCETQLTGLKMKIHVGICHRWVSCKDCRLLYQEEWLKEHIRMKHGRKIQKDSQKDMFNVLDFLDRTYFVEEQVENGATLGVEKIEEEQIGRVIAKGEDDCESKCQEASEIIEIKVFGLEEVVKDGHDLLTFGEHNLRRFVEEMMDVGDVVVDAKMAGVQSNRKPVKTSICDVRTNCRSSMQCGNNNNIDVYQGVILTLDLDTRSQNLEYKSWCNDGSQVSVPCHSNQDILELQH
jgi:hypothetical protein